MRQLTRKSAKAQVSCVCVPSPSLAIFSFLNLRSSFACARFRWAMPFERIRTTFGAAQLGHFKLGAQQSFPALQIQVFQATIFLMSIIPHKYVQHYEGIS
jgi:hypothetical protein